MLTIKTIQRPTILRHLSACLMLSACLWLAACTGIPEGIEPVTGFDSEKYLGTWHEIARFDHSFERGLEQVTADYQMRSDGGITVLNRGYDANENAWQSAEGKAYFTGDKTTAHLKVSFFGPFYGSYVVFELDENYQYAFVTSYNRDFLWLLSRQPTISDALKNKFLTRITELGFNPDEVMWVPQ